MNVYNPHEERDYIPIADHALYVVPLLAFDDLVILCRIGNLRTAALISLDGSGEGSYIEAFR